MSTPFAIVFVDNAVYGEFSVFGSQDFKPLPEKAYVYFPRADGVKWFRKDITPVLIQDVPKGTRLLALLMT